MSKTHFYFTFLLCGLSWAPTFAADLSAPLIDLPNVKLPKTADSRLIINAIVDDDSGVQNVVLYYRVLGRKGKFTPLELEPTKQKKMYEVEMPKDITQFRGIEYYIEARDVANNVTQEPFPNKPKKLVFKHKIVKYKPPKDLQWGLGINYGSFTVADPDGDTGRKLAPKISGQFSYAFNRKWRLWTEVGYSQYILPYGQETIGQEVKSFEMDLILQMTPTVQTWIGAGLNLGFNDMFDRATENNGFIVDAFEDRKEFNAGLALDAGYILGRIAKKRYFGIHAKASMTLNDGPEGFIIGGFVAFDY